MLKNGLTGLEVEPQAVAFVVERGTAEQVGPCHGDWKRLGGGSMGL